MPALQFAGLPRRRIEAVKGSTTRRFLIGPSAGTGLEVIHALVAGAGAIQALYVYHGDPPIVRFTIDAAGKRVDPVYYQEDTQGSIIGLSDASEGAPPSFICFGADIRRPKPGLRSPAVSTSTVRER